MSISPFTGWSLFLDRDGVINRQLPDDYVTTWDEFEFLPTFLSVVPHLAHHFSPIVVVTNQQGVGKGRMTLDQLADIHARMTANLKTRGLTISGVYVCPHLASLGCNCRKPKTGLGLAAKHDFPEIDFAKSVMVGDSESDMAFGRALGCFTTKQIHHLFV